MINKNVPQIRSQAKTMVIKYVKDTELEGFFSFRYKGSADQATAFVHRMRVELSRLRAQVKAAGRVVKPFKTILVSITPYKEDETFQVVVLKKTMHRFDASEVVDEIFSELAGGNIVDV